MLFVVAASVQFGEASLESQQTGARWHYTSTCKSRQPPRLNHQQNSRCQVSSSYINSKKFITYFIMLNIAAARGVVVQMLVLINEVALHWARLLLGWVTVS